MSSDTTSNTAIKITDDVIKRVTKKFLVAGELVSYEQIKRGYINDTFKIETLSKAGHIHKYVLQRVNLNVFPNIDALMHNFLIVTEHLRDNFWLPGQRIGKSSIQSLCLTKDNKAYLEDETGCWRVTRYFDDVYSLDVPDRLSTFRYAGEAFGLFAKKTADIDVNEIEIVIPDFHNTAMRYEQLMQSVKADPVGRVKEVAEEIKSMEAYKDYFALISDALESGEIPTRVCHNDCNLNNILFDNKTHLPVAIIDLDTVMPSSPLYDFGDSMRVGTNKAGDDEKDLSKVFCDLALYEEYARGFLGACGSILTKRELELLPYAALTITAEDCIRFFKDYIDGDVYYHTSYPGQNLVRAHTQMKLVQDMGKKFYQIKEILNQIYKELKLNVVLD